MNLWHLEHKSDLRNCFTIERLYPPTYKFYDISLRCFELEASLIPLPSPLPEAIDDGQPC